MLLLLLHTSGEAPPPVVVVPVDLLEAVQAWIDADAVIGTAFSRSLPLDPKRRIAEMWPQDTLPFLRIGGIDGPASYEAPDLPWTAPAEVIIECYDRTRNGAVTKANLVSTRIRNAALRWETGSCASLLRINPSQGAQQDPQPWRGGDRAWGVMMRFRALVGGSG